jgi:hypothetical protein
VKGYAKLFEDVLKEDPMAEAMLKEMFSDESFKKMLQLSYSFLPEEKVSKGDSWISKGEFPLAFLGTVKLELKYAFDGVEKVGRRDCARIKMELTKCSFEGGMLGRLTVSKKDVSGLFHLDLTEGIMVKSESKMSMTMEMDNPVDPTEPGIKLVMGATSIMKLKQPATEEGIPTEKLAAAEIVLVGKVVKTEKREGFSYWVVEVKKSLKGEISKEHVDVLAKEDVDFNDGDQCILVLKSGEHEGRKLYKLLTDKPNTFSEENVKKFEEALKSK